MGKQAVTAGASCGLTGCRNCSTASPMDANFCFRRAELPAPVTFRVAIAEDRFVAHAIFSRIDHDAITAKPSLFGIVCLFKREALLRYGQSFAWPKFVVANR